MGDASGVGDADLAHQLDLVEHRLAAADGRPSYSAALDELAQLARRHRPALQRLLTEIARRELAEVPIRSSFFDDALVDDAVQDTLLAVAAGIAGFRGEAAFLTWLDRVARNAARGVRARQRRSPSPVSSPIETPSLAARLSSLVADEQVIEAALLDLPDDYREVLMLREVDDLSYEEIAERLQVPLNTVRTRLRRARLRLADRLVMAQPGSAPGS